MSLLNKRNLLIKLFITAHLNVAFSFENVYTSNLETSANSGTSARAGGSGGINSADVGKGSGSGSATSTGPNAKADASGGGGGGNISKNNTNVGYGNGSGSARASFHTAKASGSGGGIGVGNASGSGSGQSSSRGSSQRELPKVKPPVTAAPKPATTQNEEEIVGSGEEESANKVDNSEEYADEKETIIEEPADESAPLIEEPADESGPLFEESVVNQPVQPLPNIEDGLAMNDFNNFKFQKYFSNAHHVFNDDLFEKQNTFLKNIFKN